MQVANDVLRRATRKADVRAWSQDLMEARLRLLGHILRAEDDDPMKTCVLLPGTIQERSEGVWRVGRPRTHWIEQVKAEACSHISGRDKSEYQKMAYQDEMIYLSLIHI